MQLRTTFTAVPETQSVPVSLGCPEPTPASCLLPGEPNEVSQVPGRKGLRKC